MKHGRIRTHRPATGSARGFTLLELLISIALVLSVVLIASEAMRLGQRSIASGDRKVERLERLRTTVSVLDAQIQSAVPLTYEEDGVKQYHFRGDAETLRLATNHSLWGAEKGYVVASWRVERGADGRASLFLKEQIVGTDGTREARLLEGLDEMSFAFFQRGLTDETDRWVEDWHDATDLPRKVRILMASGSWKMALVVPMRATGTLAPTAWARTEGGL